MHKNEGGNDSYSCLNSWLVVDEEKPRKINRHITLALYVYICTYPYSFLSTCNDDVLFLSYSLLPIEK